MGHPNGLAAYLASAASARSRNNGAGKNSCIAIYGPDHLHFPLRLDFMIADWRISKLARDRGSYSFER